MDETLRAYDDALITVRSRGLERSAKVYSPEGIQLVDTLALKQAAEFKRMYNFSWLGMRVIQFPLDLICLQQLIFDVRPSLIIETGIAHGGSLIFSASMLKLLDIPGKVIGIDIDIRAHNREKIEGHPLYSYISMIEGSSVDDEVVAQVANQIDPADRVFVILDSNHSYDHVRQELSKYQTFVTPGSYLVCMDAALGFVGDIPRGDEVWFEDNAIRAIREFLDDHNNYKLNPLFEGSGTTSTPFGALKKKY